ncbi:MAG: hypothetical protein L0Y42_02210 [Phycisphaerales bacterium]|nr:hypothetical protein [Phycisphaerales bacterium]
MNPGTRNAIASKTAFIVSTIMGDSSLFHYAIVSSLSHDFARQATVNNTQFVG